MLEAWARGALRLYTHLAVGSSTAITLALLAGLTARDAMIAAVAAAAANLLIDRLGHENGPIPRRRPLLHSPPGPLLATLATTPILLLAVHPIQAALAALAGAYTHLPLDAITESGIYTRPGRRARRLRLANIPYNHPAANTLATLTATTAAIAVLAAHLHP